MIDPKELRKGNWIADRGCKMWQIDCWERWDKVAAKTPIIGGIEAHPFTENISDLSPIPINPEWLEKLGFERHELGAHTLEYNTKSSPCIHVLFSTIRGSIQLGDTYLTRNGFDDDETMDVELKYIHQLQNLYHSLTGEELEYKIT